MAVLSGQTSPRVPLAHCVAPRIRDPHFVWPGATRRSFALLLAFPARRDEALRGSLGVGGDGREGGCTRIECVFYWLFALP
jgi:hypothetical protein